MRTLAFLALAVATTTTAAAQSPGMSSHPRAGLLAEINFNSGQLRLPDAAGSQLGRVAAWAEENFDGLVVLDGHADSRGENAGNVRLALQRARLVRDQLLGLGVDPDQIVISAFGPEKREKARVAVWGTHDSRESVMAARRRAHAIIDTPRRQARPGPRPSGR